MPLGRLFSPLYTSSILKLVVLAAVGFLVVSYPGLLPSRVSFARTNWHPETDLAIFRYGQPVNGTRLVNVTQLFDVTRRYRFRYDVLRAAFSRHRYHNAVLPFYRTRSIDPRDNNEVTLATWLTIDRLERLIRVSALNRGPVSAVLWIPEDHADATAALEALDEAYAAHPTLKRHVDIHLVSAAQKLQHPTWRNVARTFASTDWVLLWDIDVEPCTDYTAGLRRFREQATSKEKQRVDRGEVAFVIPAFEWSEDDEHRTMEVFCPKDKAAMSTLYKNFTIDAFESLNPLLSHATDYDRFFRTPDDAYQISEFELGYEGYIMFKKDIDVWSDDRFVGYGHERGTFTAQLYLSGIDLVVLPDQWGIESESSQKDRATEDLAAVAELSWDTFKTDLCHSFFVKLALSGTLHLDPGRRVVEFCEATMSNIILQNLGRFRAMSQRIAKGDYTGETGGRFGTPVGGTTSRNEIVAGETGEEAGHNPNDVRTQTGREGAAVRAREKGKDTGERHIRRRRPSAG